MNANKMKVEKPAQGGQAKPQADGSSRAEATGKLKIFALGGLGESIGRNLMVYQYDDDIIIVDCGIMFPEQEMLGIDFVIPDAGWLVEHRSQIRGMILTHGHEDHIGSIPYIWPRITCPMYGTRLTAGLVEVKLEEFGLKDAKVNVIEERKPLQLGKFKIEAFHLTHSIPDTVGLAITTPLGIYVHVTDWKFDHTPVDGKPSDMGFLAELSSRGVKCLLSDSTNVEVPGYTLSEQVISQEFDKIFERSKGRIIVTSFASLINRIQQVINSAVKYHRKVVISGRSMEKNVNMAMQLGYLKVPEGILTDIRQASHIRDDEVAILCTGSQGEEHSALVRMAAGEHRQIKIKKGDTVVISASAIPGNEASIGQTIDSLYREGAEVMYGEELDIHVSGHPAQEELKQMITILQPEYFIPIHGDYRFLVKHARLAESVGVDSQKIIVIENGQVAEFDKTGGRVSHERIPAGIVMVDGLGVGDVGNIVLRDRQAMAKDGIFVVILTIDRRTGKIVTSPDIISRGFVYMRAAEDLIRRAREEVKKMFTQHNSRYPANWDFIRKMIREDMGEFLFQNTQRRPMVIPVVIEV